MIKLRKFHISTGHGRIAGTKQFASIVERHVAEHVVGKCSVDYYDLGVTTFLIRGFDPLEDAADYGRELIPRTRELVAQRLAAQRKAA